MQGARPDRPGSSPLMMRPALTDITSEDIINLFAVNPLAQAQVLGFVKDRRIAELEAELAKVNGAKAEAEVPAGRG